mmetsp:Transcript_5795/g.11410  ORF Transcript_5795/g.11410 Transcript_5795/m.11410 type:complete len:286 (-) Transcript_5795:1633-2490(-)
MVQQRPQQEQRKGGREHGEEGCGRRREKAEARRRHDAQRVRHQGVQLRVAHVEAGALSGLGEHAVVAHHMHRQQVEGEREQRGKRHRGVRPLLVPAVHAPRALHDTARARRSVEPFAPRRGGGGRRGREERKEAVEAGAGVGVDRHARSEPTCYLARADEVVVASEGLEQLHHDGEVQRHPQVHHRELPPLGVLDAAVLVLPLEQLIDHHRQREEQVPHAGKPEGRPEQWHGRRLLGRVNIHGHGVGEAEERAEAPHPRGRRGAGGAQCEEWQRRQLRRLEPDRQ